ncbi:hypothetical protein [Mycobacterium sp. CnD-18-1]|uniref:phage terminase small subunit n=1 Tax=Mycobacterium sp. CnD-18-1 TaxID=2917744 RepID=UPI001EF2884E|nr:hypothetical protein [Mycobacterium sp. CnD-18-1]MCG7610354.1 hypothetical protein [Mycobacterium sp. CnD-18-1]
MAGRGPAPKPNDQRARRNADPVPMRVIVAKPVAQPALPSIYEVNPKTGKKRRAAWPAETRAWWRMWAESPLSAEFTSTDWSELVTTARLHAAVVNGELKYAAELRQRVAKFGATPEDRLRLRIMFAAADEAEQKTPAKPSQRTDRYRGLRAVGKPSA